MTAQKQDSGESDSPDFSQFRYLKDVFLCSLIAFGGPEAHLGVFLDRLVQKKKYLTEKALLEWMALCSFLPGPTSTQVITAIGLDKGGRLLGILTLLVWASPAICLMALIALLPIWSADNGLVNFTGFLGPMATGFVAWAAWALGRKVITNLLTLGLWSVGVTIPVWSTSPWAVPIGFLIGAGLSIILSPQEKRKKNALTFRLSIPWGILIIFIVLLGIGMLASFFSENSLLKNFERFYRYGYLVFGGGQVVVPLMQGELVNSAGLMNQEAFLAGFGLVQALPGPMFSFAAYAGGLCEQGGGTFRQLLGSMISGWAIFLPGTLLLFFVHPFWGKLKILPWAHDALCGINSVAGGLVAGVFLEILLKANWNPIEASSFILSLGLLIWRKVPIPFIVMIVGMLYVVLFQLNSSIAN